MDQTSYGRIDADGTVYVRTATGERVVGSWHAGSIEEGLAHFARRYADVVTEVELIETRLGSGAADATHTITRLRQIRASLDDAHVVGDLVGLGERIDKLTATAEQRAVESRAARDAARAEALARKTALVEEAEQMAASSTQWKAAGDRLREILDEWKTIKGVDKRTDGELWKRFRGGDRHGDRVAGGEDAGVAQRLLGEISDEAMNPRQERGADREVRPIAVTRAGERHHAPLAERLLDEQGRAGAGAH